MLLIYLIDLGSGILGGLDNWCSGILHSLGVLHNPKEEYYVTNMSYGSQIWVYWMVSVLGFQIAGGATWPEGGVLCY